MKRIRFLFLSLLPFVGMGQLVLPEFMGPDEGGEVGEGENGLLIEPDQDRHQGSGDKEKKDEAAAEAQAEAEREEDVNEMIQVMDRLRGSQVSLSPEQLKKLQKSQQPMDELKQVYLSGPSFVKVNILSKDGSTVQGKVENLTCRVKTSVGILPVRLHEIVKAKRLKQGGAFALELKDGDYMEGQLTDFFLLVRMPDGSHRELTEKAMVELEAKAFKKR